MKSPYICGIQSAQICGKPLPRVFSRRLKEIEGTQMHADLIFLIDGREGSICVNLQVNPAEFFSGDVRGLKTRNVCNSGCRITEFK